MNCKGEYVVVERGDLPVAVIMNFDEFEDYLDLRDPAVRERIAEANRGYHAGESVPAEDLLIPRLKRGAPVSRRRKKTSTAKR